MKLLLVEDDPVHAKLVGNGNAGCVTAALLEGIERVTQAKLSRGLFP